MLFGEITRKKNICIVVALFGYSDYRRRHTVYILKKTPTWASDINQDESKYTENNLFLINSHKNLLHFTTFYCANNKS